MPHNGHVHSIGSIVPSARSRYAGQRSEAQEKLRSTLTARFAQTDTRVGASRSTLSFLQNQIDAWNAPRN